MRIFFDDALSLLGNTIFFEADGAGGGGGGDDKDDDPLKDLKPELPKDVLDQLQQTAEAKGGHQEFNKILYGDNHKLREKNRKLQEMVPGKGTVILSKKESDELESYRKLGTIEELTPKLDKLPTLEKEVTETKRSATISEAAEVHGYNSKLLRKLSDADGIKLEIGEQTDGDKKVKAAYVVSTDSEGKETKKLLSEYVESNWNEFSDALGKPGGEGKGGTKFPKQTRSSSTEHEETEAKKRFRERREKRESKGNALTGFNKNEK